MGVPFAVSVLAYGIFVPDEEYNTLVKCAEWGDYGIEEHELEEHFEEHLIKDYSHLRVRWIPGHGNIFYIPGTITELCADNFGAMEYSPIPASVLNVSESQLEDFRKQLAQLVNTPEKFIPQWRLYSYCAGPC